MSNRKNTLNKGSFFLYFVLVSPNYLEIKNVVFNLNGNRARGPDGFGGVFYHSCWEIIETNVCKTIQQFFKQN